MNPFEVGHLVAVRAVLDWHRDPNREHRQRWRPANVVEVYPLAVAVHILDHAATGHAVVDNWYTRWMIPLVVDADLQPAIMALTWEPWHAYPDLP